MAAVGVQNQRLCAHQGGEVERGLGIVHVILRAATSGTFVYASGGIFHLAAVGYVMVDHGLQLGQPVVGIKGSTPLVRYAT